MTLIRNPSSCLPALGIAVLAMLAMPQAALGTQFTPSFGNYHLARGQAAQLNVVLPPNPLRDPCNVVLKFVDALGDVFEDAAGNEVSETVMLGRASPSAHLVLSFKVAIMRDDGGKRAPFRPVVSENPNNETCAAIVATLEVFEEKSGKTLWVAGPPSPIVPPQPV